VDVQRMSSRMTMVTKWVFPIFMLGFLVLFVVFALTVRQLSIESLPVLIIPLVMGVVGYYVLKATVFDLVDEVWDAGDFLVVRNRGEEVTIRLEEIVNVNYSNLSKTKRVVLRLRKTSRLGNEIAFVPVAKVSVWPPVAKNPMIEKLIDRIDAARRKHGG
jgi:hypothetical protein